VITRIGIDIRFRMFKTHELARAMGFEKYQFTGNSEEVTRQIGNAVEVNQAKALVGALLAK
jgi:site-specific DNA-cytosine methylase